MGSLGKLEPVRTFLSAAKGGIKYIECSSRPDASLSERTINDVGYSRGQHLAHFTLVAVMRALEAGVINRHLQNARTAATTRP